MRPTRYLLLLLLVLTAGISLTAGQDEEAEIEEAEAEVEAEVDVVETGTEEPTTAAPLEEFSGELTPSQCDEAPEAIKAKCCKAMMDVDDKFIKCFMLHQKKMPKKGKENPVALIKFFSCLIECVYKAKKYMTKDEKINMGMVKADANKLYKDDPKQRDFMIAQYEHCEREGGLEWKKLKKNPASKVIFKGACKPYYLFVFLCTMDYGKVSCPYFKWEHSKEYKEECRTLKEKCQDMQ